MDNLYSLAKKLRKDITLQENKLWNLLRNRQMNGYKFVRQYPIGPYIVDFACRKHKLIIELDGGQHNIPENIILDKERENYLISRGYKIIRFWNNEIDQNIEGVYIKILSFLENK